MLFSSKKLKKKTKKKDDHILLLGIGGVGMHLARRLIHEGHSLTIIESNVELLHEASEFLDAQFVEGSVMQLSCWREARAEEKDVMIAATNDDAVNMLAALIADRFHIPQKIARVRSLDFENDSVLPAEVLSIDLMVHPEELLAQDIARLVQQFSGHDLIDLGDSNIQVLAVRVNKNSPLEGKTPRELADIYTQYTFRIVSVARGINSFIPQAHDVIQDQDQLFVMAKKEDIPFLMDEMNVRQHKVEQVMILGGGLVGARVAQLLANQLRVKLIEKNPKRAEELVDFLPHTEILCGDGDTDLLIMAGLMDMDLFIATTGDNETNIITCLLAKHLMNRQNRDPKGFQGKSVAMVNRHDYMVLASTIGLDTALSLKISAADAILKFIRQNELLSVAHLHGVDAEVVEIIASEGSMITRKPLKKLASYFKQNKILIGGVKQGGVWNIAIGDTHVQAGEHVFAVSSSQQLNFVRKLFE